MIIKSRKSSLKTLKAGLLAFAMVAAPVTSMVIATPAMAQDDEKAKASKSMSTGVAKVVSAVYEAVQAAGDNEAASKAASRDGIARLSKLLTDKPNMDPFDKATVLEIRAQMKVRLADYGGALKDYEEVLRLDALPQARLVYVRKVMAQLYFSEEQYSRAARFLEEYIRTTDETVSASIWYYLAASYYSLEQYQKAVEPARKAIAGSDKPNKGYYELLNTIYNVTGQEAKRGDLLVTMVNIWPGDKNLWAQLASAYASAGKDREAAVVLELAYKAGLVQDENKIIALVQYYSLLENPYRGAILLEREMAAGNVQKTKKNYELLGQMWNLSREQKKSIAAYEQVAKLSSDGKASYNLGRVYYADEQWSNAERALAEALRKGGLKSEEIGDAWLLIGSARLSRAGDDPTIRKSARDAFAKAAQYPKSRRSANGWIQYIDEIIRVERAQDAVERAQKEEAFQAEIKSCETLVAIADRGGVVDNPQRVTDCRKLLDDLEAGIKPDDSASPEAPAEEAATEEEATEE